jgi:hypothetical protein
MDRATVRAMAENYWRAKFAVRHQQSQKQEREMAFQFTDQVNALAASMPADQAQEFQRMIGEERDALIDEKERDQAAFQRRLGVPPAPPPVTRYHRQGIGEMAVRTAVRASIWTTIFRLFR